MGVTAGTIPNLLGGVSQQAVSMRLPSQGELQENFYSTVIGGLRKRPPTEHVACILPTAPATAFFHIIDRDDTERYVVVISGGTLRVFDLDGVEKVVNAPSGWGYLSGSPSEDFRALTVADYTFVVNRSRPVAMASTQSPTRPHEALVNILQGNYGKSYKVVINDNTVAHYNTPKSGLASNAPLVDTTLIAQVLLDGTDPNSSEGLSLSPDGTEGRDVSGIVFGSTDAAELARITAANRGRVVKTMSLQGITPDFGWTASRYQHAIHVSCVSSDFTIAVEDGFNGNAVKVVKGSAQQFSDLPSFAPMGFVAEVLGDGGTLQDNYWVIATKDGGANSNSAVVWKETVKPGTQLGFDASTMPHTLVREADGSFTFRPADWDRRKCGDGDKINPDPSFVGNTITDIFFHRNRLGFLADENVVMSRAGSFFDFWRTTATALLDDDPIDVAASHIKVAVLQHALPTQDYLLVFSSETQFRLAGNELLTPRSVSLRPLTEFSCSKKAQPVMSGKSVFFVSDGDMNRDWSAVYDFFVDKSLETGDAQNIAAHVPGYIPSEVRKMVGSSDLNILALASDLDPGSLYVYSYLWQGDQRVMSSWSRWSFPGASILDMAFLDTRLFLLTLRDGAVWLETIRMEPSAVDEEIGAVVALDRRVRSEDLSSPLYDPLTETTEYTLPFPAPASLQAVVVGGSGTVGSNVPVLHTEGASVTLHGDTRGVHLLLGAPYTSRWRFSPIFVRKAGSDGGAVTATDGRLQLHHLSLAYDTSRYFRVEVSVEGRDVSIYPFMGPVFGDPSNIIGGIPLDTDRFNVPVMSRSDRVRIDIVNDSWLPSNFLSAGWRGSWNQKLRQV